MSFPRSEYSFVSNGTTNTMIQSRSLRDRIFDFAQRINQKTPWLDGLKDRLGLRRFVENALHPAPTGDAVVALAASLNDHIITDRVRALRASGIEEIDFYVLLVQCLGDIVACEPIPRFLKSIAPKSRVHWILCSHFRELVDDNPYIDEVIGVDAISDGKAICAEKATAPNAIIVDCHFDGTSCPKTRTIYRNPNNPQVTSCTYFALGSLLDAFALAAGLPRISDGPEFHYKDDVSQPDNLPANYVVFHCGSNDAHKDWIVEKWLQLAKQLRENNLTPIEIGTVRKLAQDHSVVDLTGNRSLQQLALVIKNARAFVGVDSVFAHVANAVRTPAVALLGKYRDFETYMPYSGEFAHSSRFAVVRAPNGKRAEAIQVADVMTALRRISTSCPPRHNSAAPASF